MSDNIFGSTLEDEPVTDPSIPSTPAPSTPAPVEEPPAPPAEPEPAAPAGEETPDDDEAAHLAGPGADGIRLGDRVYKDWQGADHVFKQFRGRAKAAEERAKAAQERAEKAERLLEASLSRTTAQEPAAATPAPEPPAATVAPKRIADAFSEEQLDELIADKGPAGALKAILAIIDERVPEVIDERTEPAQRIARREQGLNLAAELFNRVASEGTFAELTPDSPASQAIVDIWTSEVLNDPDLSKLALTPKGIELAVIKYRASNPSATATPPAPPAARLVAQVKAAATAQRGLSDLGQQSARPQPGPTKVSSADLEEAARLAIASRRHEVFGFETE